MGKESFIIGVVGTNLCSSEQRRAQGMISSSQLVMRSRAIKRARDRKRTKEVILDLEMLLTKHIRIFGFYKQI